MLDALREGLAHLKTTLVVRNLLEKRAAIELSTLEIADPEGPASDVVKVEGSVMETSDSRESAEDDVVSMDPSVALEAPSSLAAERKSARYRALTRPAMWSLVAMAPPLLFVPQIRHRC